MVLLLSWQQESHYFPGSRNVTFLAAGKSRCLDKPGRTGGVPHWQVRRQSHRCAAAARLPRRLGFVGPYTGKGQRHGAHDRVTAHTTASRRTRQRHGAHDSVTVVQPTQARLPPRRRLGHAPPGGGITALRGGPGRCRPRGPRPASEPRTGRVRVISESGTDSSRLQPESAGEPTTSPGTPAGRRRPARPPVPPSPPPLPSSSASESRSRRVRVTARSCPSHGRVTS